MDLVLVSSDLKVIAIKSGGCYRCVEEKLNTKILRVFPTAFSSKDYKDKDKDLSGYNISCVCKNFIPIIEVVGNSDK